VEPKRTLTERELSALRARAMHSVHELRKKVDVAAAPASVSASTNTKIAIAAPTSTATPPAATSSTSSTTTPTPTSMDSVRVEVAINDGRRIVVCTSNVIETFATKVANRKNVLTSCAMMTFSNSLQLVRASISECYVLTHCLVVCKSLQFNGSFAQAVAYDVDGNRVTRIADIRPGMLLLIDPKGMDSVSEYVCVCLVSPCR
jgi:hypothetical protein